MIPFKKFKPHTYNLKFPRDFLQNGSHDRLSGTEIVLGPMFHSSWSSGADFQRSVLLYEFLGHTALNKCAACYDTKDIGRN